MIWNYPVVITIENRTRIFHMKTSRNLLPKGNVEWFMVNVVEFDSDHRVLAKFEFLHNIISLQTETERLSALMPVNEICAEMHKQVKAGKELW